MKEIVILMEEEVVLEKYLLLLKGKGYSVTGINLMDEKLEKTLENISNLDLLIIEIEEVNCKIKRIIKKVREKFKNSKILILIPEFNEMIETLISEFNIDAYLTFPFLPFHLLRSIYLLEKF